MLGRLMREITELLLGTPDRDFRRCIHLGKSQAPSQAIMAVPRKGRAKDDPVKAPNYREVVTQ
jgi:hypothetical protein